MAEEQPLTVPPQDSTPDEGLNIPCCWGQKPFLHLNPGVSLFNLAVFLYASFANVSALVFLNGALPYLLTNFLNIPLDEQGRFQKLSVE